jgi:hypothetical protein
MASPHTIANFDVLLKAAERRAGVSRTSPRVSHLVGTRGNWVESRRWTVVDARLGA